MIKTAISTQRTTWTSQRNGPPSKIEKTIGSTAIRVTRRIMKMIAPKVRASASNRFLTMGRSSVSS